MKPPLHLEILRQPDLSTCGPTCLHALYRYYDDPQPLADVVARVQRIENGGTLAVMLGCDALRRGYGAEIHTFNVEVFDPTWFVRGRAIPDLDARLAAQAEAKPDDDKLRWATDAYREFLRLGGRLTWGDLRADVLTRHLGAERPILTGLSSTYLYQEAREDPVTGAVDDVRGRPAGHFVVLTGYDPGKGTVHVADPLDDTPLADAHHYDVPIERVVCAILLGIVTYDANLLVVRPDAR